jgi:hypothetical protein
MADGDGHGHNQLRFNLLNKVYNLAAAGDVLKMSIVSDTTIAATGTLSITALTKFTGANYVDKTIAGQVTAQDDVGNKGWLDANDITWTALGGNATTAKWFVLWDDTVTSPTADAVLAWWEIGATSQPNGGDFGFTVNVLGLLSIA